MRSGETVDETKHSHVGWNKVHTFIEKNETKTEDFTDEQFLFVRSLFYRRKRKKTSCAKNSSALGSAARHLIAVEWNGPLVPIRWRTRSRMTIENFAHHYVSCRRPHRAMCSILLLNWHKNFGQIYYKFICVTHDGEWHTDSRRWWHRIFCQ